MDSVTTASAAPYRRAFNVRRLMRKLGFWLSVVVIVSLMRGLSGTSRDVPPFAIVDWQHTVRGVNVVGLKRAGFDETRIRLIRQAFRVLFRSGRNLALAVKEVETSARVNSDVLALLEFINSSKRGVCFGAD